MNLSKLARMIVGLLFLLAPKFALGQQSGALGTTTSNIPVLASGQLPSVTPASEEAPTNVFSGGITLGGNYDDNVEVDASSRVWDIEYMVMPHISFEETHRRIAWGLSYTPGVELSQRLLSRNLFAQRFGGHLVWRTSPHGILSAQQYYLVTMNPFEGFADTSPGPTISPNETLYIPNVRRTLLLSNVLYSYQSSARTTMGVGGTFELQKYDDTPQSGPTTALIHSQVASGEAYIAYQFTPRNQIGFQYGLQVLRFPQVDGRTTTHSFLVFDQMNLSSQTRLTLYGGPEYSLTSNEIVLNLGFVFVSLPVNATKWTGAGGVIYNWTGDHLAAAIDFSRRVSDGGGLVGAVELTYGRAELAWRFSRNWSLTSGILGADNQLLAVTNGNDELRTYSGQIGLHRQLGRTVGIRTFYERLNETGSFNGLSIGNRDIVGVSLDYSFMKPLGG